ncbi:MAG: hypothetical protein LUF91_08585 [Oscillospiraceae bacterium]|nr:hypothetical protein [Oscillospiraceae bacterium]
MRNRIFVDMDGTLAEWQSAKKYEDLYDEGYFHNLPAMESVIEATKKLVNDERFEVFILSASLPDSVHAIPDKNIWLDRYLPEIDTDHRIFTDMSKPKTEFVPGGIRKSDVLLDDYSKNLHDWAYRGISIKVLNGINGTNGSWLSTNGEWVKNSWTPQEIYDEIVKILIGENKRRESTM